ncbi:MAG TPA: amidohydrolase family protein, partial [Spirochaetia bacterium]|nr:amidohydrolase family protein [Spirochaetia bacterium]
ELLYRARQDGVNITASQNPYHSIGGPLNAYFIGHLLSNMGHIPVHDGIKDISILTSLIEKIFQVFPPASILLTEHAVYAGKTIQDIADIQSKDPVEVLVQIYTEANSTSVAAFTLSEKIMKELMAHDFVFTSSNGSLCIQDDKHHPRSFGSFPRKIRVYAIEQGLMSLSQAISSMTSRPADFLNLKNRGRIAEGYYADLVIFDQNRLTDMLDYLSPNQYPQGIEHVIVNGKPIIKDGCPGDKLSGKPLTLNAH